MTFVFQCPMLSVEAFLLWSLEFVSVQWETYIVLNVKTLNARTRYSGSSTLFNSPQCSVLNLSDARPPQPFEINDTVPWGLIPIKNFAVLCCLYEDHVWARSSTHEGLSIKTSKKSIITAHEENFSLKQAGNVIFRSSLSGDFTRWYMHVNITCIQVWNTPDTVDAWTPNR